MNQDAGEQDAQWRAEDRADSTDESTDHDLASRQRGSGAADAADHRHLADLFVDRGGHAHRHDEGADQEAEHREEHQPEARGFDLTVVPGAGKFGGFHHQGSFDPFRVLLDPGAGVEAIIKKP